MQCGSANCAKCRKMIRCWICADIWLDMFPFFDRPQLGLKLALISPRFNILVDKHFDGKSELTIWRPIAIRKDSVAKVPKVSVFTSFANSMDFPLPDRPLPNKIRFECLQIHYIDHFVITFLRANKQIWDKIKTNLRLNVSHNNERFVQHAIWNALVREILPIFAPNIRHLCLHYSDHLRDLLRISPTILSDLKINEINYGWLKSDDYEEPNAIAMQVLNEWLHTLNTDGQPKRLFCCVEAKRTMEWVNNFKERFLRATNSLASYQIQFTVYAPPTQIVPFELTNERTNEKLTLEKESGDRRKISFNWVMKRCQIGGTIHQWEDKKTNNLNNVIFTLKADCIGVTPFLPLIVGDYSIFPNPIQEMSRESLITECIRSIESLREYILVDMKDVPDLRKMAARASYRTLVDFIADFPGFPTFPNLAQLGIHEDDNEFPEHVMTKAEEMVRSCVQCAEVSTEVLDKFDTVLMTTYRNVVGLTE